MKRIRTITIFLLVLQLSSCATRKVQKTREKVHLIEKGVIDRKLPGDRVYIEFPKTPRARPKSITRTYTGEKGAIVKVPFDSLGSVTGIEVDCPEITEREKYDREMDFKIKEKETTRELNMKLLDRGYGLLIKLGMMGFGAWTIIGVSREFFARKR